MIKIVILFLLIKKILVYFSKLKMNWVSIPREHCVLECPPHTQCMRPVEFTEPIYCIHQDFKFPQDLLNKPNACNVNVMIVAVVLTVLLQVEFLIFSSCVLSVF